MKSRWLGLWVLAACGIGHDRPDAQVGDGGSDGDIPTMEIDGTGLVHFVDDQGITDADENFTMSTILSITPTADGRFDHHDGVGNSDGTFTVLVDQDATSWDLGISLVTGLSTTYVVGSSQSPDLSQYFLGRGSIVFTTTPTPITLSATGMAPWGAIDDLELFSSNAGAIYFSPQTTFSPALTSGKTSFTSQTVPWTNQVPQLVDSNQGDTIMLFQLSTKSSGGDQYAALSRTATSTSFTQTAGQNDTLSLALTAVTADETLAVHWKRSQFEALRSSAGPGATDATGLALLAIDALPGALTRGFFSSAPDLVEFSHPPAGTTDLDETFQYANPFSTGGVRWDEFVIVSYEFNAPVKAPNAANPTSVVTGSYEVLPVSALAATGTIGPAMSGLGTISVGGMDATTSAQTGVGMTPKITWHSPTGPYTGYQVTIQSVSSGNGGTKLTTVGVFDTSEASLQVPDILTAGTSYIAIITAIYSDGWDLSNVPFIFPLPYAQFVTVTAQWQP